MPIDFPLFGLTLIGVAVFHHRTLQVSLAGLAAIVTYKLLFSAFPSGPVILLTAPIRRPDWELLGEAGRGAVFLLSLVLAASIMPVEQLPPASVVTAFGLGFVSAVFDNIPLTKLALEQGGYIRLGRTCVWWVTADR